MKKSIKSMLMVAFALSLVLSFVGCKADADDEAVVVPGLTGSGFAEVYWNGIFTDSYATDTFGLVGPTGAYIVKTAGAMAQNACSTSVQVQSGGYYNTKSAVHYISVGGDWGGVFYHLAEPVDLIALGATELRIAVKGALPGIVYWQLKAQSGVGGAAADLVNLVSDATITSDGEWTLYTIALTHASFATVDFSEFFGFGLYHPRTILSGVDTVVNPSVIACDVLVSAAFF